MMGNDTVVGRVLNNYRKLCGYCDLIWERVREAYPGEIACRKGCGICCELQTVNRLEAYAIRSYITDNKILLNGMDDNDFNASLKSQPDDSAGACPFLHRQSCLIYDARPVICRTHGLILRSSDFPLTRQAASCPYNFPSIHPNDFPPELTVDVDRITENLVNLNLAFCTAAGINVGDELQSRAFLRDLVPLF